MPSCKAKVEVITIGARGASQLEAMTKEEEPNGGGKGGNGGGGNKKKETRAATETKEGRKEARPRASQQTQTSNAGPAEASGIRGAYDPAT